MRAGALGVCVGLAGCTWGRAPDVLLVSLDTVRADALGSYGGPPGLTPTLDGLAARGLRGAEVMSTAPQTVPAHASLLTGRWADAHGLQGNDGAPLGAAFPTLAHHLRPLGYLPAGFVGAAVLGAHTGLDQGFSRWEAEAPPGGPPGAPPPPQWPAAPVVARALDWAAAQSDGRPLFAFVHLYDAHAPHAPAPDFAARAPGAPYLGEVAAVDAAVGDLLAGWAARRGGEPLVIVVADHGEGLGDHGEAGHGWFVYRSTMRVPLLMAGPGVPAGAVHEGPASLVDVVPTLFAALGQPAPAGLDGESLLAPARPERRVRGETWLPWLFAGFSPLHVVQDGAHRAIRAPRPELYALAADPAEEADRWATEGAAWAEAFVPPVETARPGGALAADTAAALAALGYLPAGTAGAFPGAIPGLPDPKDAPGLLDRVLRLFEQGWSLPPAAALAEADALLAAHPGLAAVARFRAHALFDLGQLDAAAEALAPLRAAAPTDDALADLALTIATIEADAAAVATLLASPAGSAPVRAAATATAACRAGDAAAGFAALGGSAAPENPALLGAWARCAAAEGRAADAEAALTAALARAPHARGLRGPLHELRTARGDAAGAEAVRAETRAFVRPDPELLWRTRPR